MPSPGFPHLTCSDRRIPYLPAMGWGQNMARGHVYFEEVPILLLQPLVDSSCPLPGGTWEVWEGRVLAGLSPSLLVVSAQVVWS